MIVVGIINRELPGLKEQVFAETVAFCWKYAKDDISNEIMEEAFEAAVSRIAPMICAKEGISTGGGIKLFFFREKDVHAISARVDIIGNKDNEAEIKVTSDYGYDSMEFDSNKHFKFYDVSYFSYKDNYATACSYGYNDNPNMIMLNLELAEKYTELRSEYGLMYGEIYSPMSIDIFDIIDIYRGEVKFKCSNHSEINTNNRFAKNRKSILA